jgi:hypothetical protein
MAATMNSISQPSGGRTGGVYIPPFKLALMKKQKEAESELDAGIFITNFLK